jgi:hypothetical protein
VTNYAFQIWDQNFLNWPNFSQVPGCGQDIEGTGSVWIIGCNRVPGGFGIQQLQGGGGWAQMPGGAVRISVDPWR